MWRSVDETVIIPVDPSKPLDTTLFDKYDICITGAAMKFYQAHPSWNDLVQNTWVYARVSPAQKEFILTSLKSLGYVTLMAGDGTNDVGALKQAHIGVALLDGTEEDLKKIAEHQRNERVKKVYESQLKISARFGQVPPPVPPVIAHLYPEVVEAQKKAAADQQNAKKKNPMEKVRPLCVVVRHIFDWGCSSTLRRSRTSWRRWTARTRCRRSSSATRPAPRRSRRSCPTSAQVRSSS